MKIFRFAAGVLSFFSISIKLSILLRVQTEHTETHCLIISFISNFWGLKFCQKKQCSRNPLTSRMIKSMNLNYRSSISPQRPISINKRGALTMKGLNQQGGFPRRPKMSIISNVRRGERFSQSLLLMQLELIFRVGFKALTFY